MAVKPASEAEQQKAIHHHKGVFSSTMPQTLSVIQEKLRLFRTKGSRGHAGRFDPVQHLGGTTRFSF